MGFLGLSLFFAGIVLVLNGLNALLNVDAKSTAVMNLITAGVLIIGNFIMLSKAEVAADFMNTASGLLFGTTYVFVACNNLFSLDVKPFGFFCFFGTAYAVTLSVVSFVAGDLLFGILWAAWSLIWLDGFLELALGLKLGKTYPFLVILEGLFAAFIPAVLMLLEVL